MNTHSLTVEVKGLSSFNSLIKATKFLLEQADDSTREQALMMLDEQGIIQDFIHSMEIKRLFKP